jgi:hypothetical protein
MRCGHAGSVRTCAGRHGLVNFITDGGAGLTLANLSDKIMPSARGREA